MRVEFVFVDASMDWPQTTKSVVAIFSNVSLAFDNDDGGGSGDNNSEIFVDDVPAIPLISLHFHRYELTVVVELERTYSQISSKSHQAATVSAFSTVVPCVERFQRVFTSTRTL